MEQQRNTTERQAQPHAEIQKAAAERLREIENHGEKQTGRSETLAEVREKLRQVEQVTPAAEVASKAEPTHNRPVLTKAASYRNTLRGLQHRMKPGSRAFSQFIHSPAVDTTSEIVGKTVLRPSVSAGATTTAVLLTGFLYIYARRYGFVLRGSEIWISLLAGGVFGLVLEVLYKTIRRMTGRI